MPDFKRIDPMPMRNVACTQQIVDGGGTRTALIVAKVAKNLAEKTALGMRTEVEFANEEVCVGAHGAVVSAASVDRQTHTPLARPTEVSRH
jgi:hypothetical protein